LPSIYIVYNPPFVAVESSEFSFANVEKSPPFRACARIASAFSFFAATSSSDKLAPVEEFTVNNKICLVVYSVKSGFSSQ